MRLFEVIYEGHGPFPCCVCEAPPDWALIMMVQGSMGVAVGSWWFCNEHQSGGWSVVLEADERDEMATMVPASEGPAEIDALHAMMQEVVDEALRQRSPAADNGSARRARAAGRHRQRRGRQVAPRSRPKHQGPQTA